MIRDFFEENFGQENLMTAETYMAFGLVCMKLGQFDRAVEDLGNALRIYQMQLGEFEYKTKEVGHLLN